MKKSIETTSSPDKEIQFIIHCCYDDLSNENIAFIRDLHHSIELSELINMAHWQGILPLVYKTLKTIDETTHNETLNIMFETFKQKYMQTVQTNMLMTSELLQITHLFETNGIEVIAYKGPVLAHLCYGDITFRQFGDLDILVSFANRRKAVELLMQSGYTPEIILKEETKAYFFNTVNVLGLYKNALGIYVEVHWELLSRNYAVKWKEKDLWNDRYTVKLNQKSITTLKPEQHLLYLCIHGSKHLFERLIWVCDIDRFVRSNPTLNWDSLLQESRKMGTRRMLFLGLGLSARLLGLTLPVAISEGIKKDTSSGELIEIIIHIHYSGVSGKRKSYNNFRLLSKMREKPKDKLLFIWRALFTTKFDDFKFVQLPKNLAFLYPFIRPLRLIKKYF